MSDELNELKKQLEEKEKIISDNQKLSDELNELKKQLEEKINDKIKDLLNN